MKKILSFIGVIIAVIVVGFIVLSLTVDGFVKSSIQDKGSNMLHTSVDVDDVGLSILKGTGTIDGISIHNPEGFSDNSAVKLKRITMSIDLSTLLSDTVVVKNIDIQQPELFFEQKGSSNNFQMLKNNMSEGSSSGTKVVVDHLLVNHGRIKIHADVAGRKEATQGKFDQLELTDIGRNGSNTMQQTMRQILEPILERAARQAIKDGLLEKAKEKINDLLGG